MKLLIADDDEGICGLLTTYGERRGWTCLVARAGPRALEVAAAEKPAAVLLDMNLPQMDGRQVCAELRKRPATRKTPIVIITGQDEPALKKSFLEAGADEFVSKPLRLADLFDTLQRLAARVK